MVQGGGRTSVAWLSSAGDVRAKEGDGEGVRRGFSSTISNEEKESQE